MSDDVERLMAGFSLGGPPAELRGRVLDAMGAELDRSHRRRRDWRIVAGLGLSLVVAILANHVVAARQDAALARFFGPSRESRQIAELVAMVREATDAKTAALIRARLEEAANRPRPPCTLAALEHYERTLCQMAKAALETPYETNENHPEMDRPRVRDLDRGAPTSQRGLGLDVRFTA
jgi:hypothetical protein